MADTRGMYDLGRALNTAADTFGNLSTYAPDGLKQTAVAAQTAKAKNDLTSANLTAADLAAEQQWQQEAASRDDFGTEDYAKDYTNFLRNAGASPAKITSAQMAAKAAAHTGQMQDLAQSYVQNAVEDKIASTLGQEYYKDHLKDLQVQLVKDGATAADAAAKMRDAAIQAGRNYMDAKGIVVNIDHNTGNIMAMDSEGNTIPIDPSIAASAYKILGQNAPWSALKDIQNESLATGKALGTTAYGGAPATGASPAVSSHEAAAALKALPGLETHYRTIELAALKAGTDAYAKAYAAARADGASKEDATADAEAHKEAALKTYQPSIDRLKAEVDAAHRTAARTGAVQAAAAAPPPPPAPPAKPPTPEELAAMSAGAPPEPKESNLVHAGQNSPQAIAARAAALVRNLHLDHESLQSPEVQAYINSLDPQTKATLTDLLQHAAQVIPTPTSPGVPVY